MDMTTRFLQSLQLGVSNGTWRRTNRPFCEHVLFLVTVFTLVVLWGCSSDKNILVTAAPLGRRATYSQPSGGLTFRSSAANGGGGVSKSCPEEDVGVKTFLAQAVFEGKARSRSPLRDGVYNVTFVVQHVYKGAEPGFLRSQVRLQFAEKAIGSNNNYYYHKCNEEGNRRSVVKANIKRGGKYIVFVDKIEPHIFKAHGEPAKRNEKNVKAVKDLLCHNCVRPPSLSGLHNVTLKPKQKLKLVCRTKGNPLPTILWYKDGERVRPSRKTRIHTKKKRSTLVIPRLKPEDAGLYECQAKSVTGQVANLTARVTVNTDTRQENTTTLWPLYAIPCPVDTYCLNGATCQYYDTVGELVCQCADGYKGQRCENKDVNRGSMYRSKFCNRSVEESAAAAVAEFDTREGYVRPDPDRPWWMLDIQLRGWPYTGLSEIFAGLPSPHSRTEFH